MPDAYDRRGGQKTIAQNGMTTTLGYNDANQLLTEAYTARTLGGFTVTSGYNNFLRRHSLSLDTQPSAINISYRTILAPGSKRCRTTPAHAKTLRKFLL